mgnify:CR=1 FL=1
MFATHQAPIYRQGSRAQRKVLLAGVVAGLFALLCACWVLISVICEPIRSQRISGGLAAMWAVGAPLWFWYEYFYIYRARGGGLADSFDQFKHGQQTAVAIWAGLTVSLTAFAASDFSKPPSAKYACTVEVPKDLSAVDPASGAQHRVSSVLICSKSAT